MEKEQNIITQVISRAQGNQDVIAWIKGPLSKYLDNKKKEHKLDLSAVEHIVDYLISDCAPRPSKIRNMKVGQARKAAENGHTEIVNYLRSIGRKWTRKRGSSA